MTPHPHSSQAFRHQLALGWVLHALEPEDDAVFGAHLPECEDCVAAVAETAGTLGVLARAVPQVDPPPRLRARLLAAIAEDEATTAPGDPAALADSIPAARSDGESPVPAPSPVPTPAPEPGPASVPAPPSVPGQAWEPPLTTPTLPRRRGRTVRRLLVGAAAVALVVAVGGLAVVNQTLRAERDAQVAAANQAGQVEDVLRDAGAPGAVHATLAAPDGALVGLVVDTGGGPRVLTTGLSANRDDHVYVLWALAAGRAAPVGTFDVSGEAPNVRPVPSTGQAGSLAGYAVSLEPGRIAPAAPTQIVASGQVGR